MDNHINNEFEYQIYENVLNEDDCNILIKHFIEYKQATTFINDVYFDKKNRDAKTALYDEEHPILKRIRKIISEKTETNINQQETPVSVIKYDVGGFYKPHYDYFDDSIKFNRPKMGNRLKTAILYLNDDYEGGETHFPLKNIKIKGKQGNLLVWRNLNKNNTPNAKTLHAGLPVIKGTKYIVVSWIRENIDYIDTKKTLI